MVLIGSTAPAAETSSELSSAEASETFFENKIRPVLAQRCFECHDGETQEGELRLDRRDHLLRGGRSGKAVLPGDPRGSLVIRLIRRIDPELKMPPDDEARLTPEEIENFIAWVKMGAPFPGSADDDGPVKGTIDLEAARKFWSFEPLRFSEPTTNGMTTSESGSNEIDFFIRQRLQSAGMTPSPKADKRTLLRRVTYDLTGLPPTPEETSAFLADSSPNALEKIVERLLDSPQYGVHWGRHWLDVARYADTRWVGAGEDKRWPFAYTYRDWVIQALNEDMPYDRFVELQLAADQVADARPSDQAALGFLTVGRWFTGTMPDVIDDQIDVVTRGLLGLSVQCARCHNHKFDPITAQDYYSLYGLFAAARMPVDGSGLMAKLPEIAARPATEEVAKEIASLRAHVDDFINARLEQLREDFRRPVMLTQYLPIAETLLAKTDNEAREFAKAQQLDERLLLRWVRYLKGTTKTPHPIFAAWHALAALPEAEFKSRAADEIEKLKAGKLNRFVVEILSPAPKSLDELTRRYVELLLKHDGPTVLTDLEKEPLRQVLRGNDVPTQIPVNELSNYLTPEEKLELQVRKRALTAKLATLPESADLYLSYERDAGPIETELNEFMQQRRTAVEADIRTPEKIAAALQLVAESETLTERRFKEMIRGKQLSERLVERWNDYLEQAAQRQDDVFGPWRVFTAARREEFDESTVAALAERARKATRNAVVAAAFKIPPTSLDDAAQRYAELIVRFAGTKPFPQADEEAIRQISAADDSPLRFADRDVVDYFTQKDYDELRNKERKLVRLGLESLGTPPRAPIVSDSSRSYAQRVFVRGNPNVPGEPSHGGFLSVLSSKASEPAAFQAGQGRRDLARAIVDGRNPLAARVIVNRVWQWHFGTGLVQTSSDFGTRGSAPTHPELLDWLAQTLIDDGWSLKKLHRRILSSATWQQASVDQPKYRELDPDNRLLWRMNRHRLSFEELRDSLLTAAGRLDPTLGGRSVDLTKNMTRRRSAYGTVDRLTLPGFYRYFDFPGSETHTSERQETTVAQQALYLMNNAFVMEQAGLAAARAADIHDPTTRVNRLYESTFGRLPTNEERELGLEYVRMFAATKQDVKEPVPNTSAKPVAAPSLVVDHSWRYGWGTYQEQQQRVTEFQPFPFFGGNQWKGSAVETDPLLGRASLNSRGGYAGPSSQLAVVRRWIAPRAGRLQITGIVSASPTSVQPLGDGVRARIVSSRHGLLGMWIVHGTEEPTIIDGTTVQPGDTIDFVVDGRGRELHGTFTWAPLLRMPMIVDTTDDSTTTEAAALISKGIWDAVKDFHGNPAESATDDVWQRYAHVLLQTNEFMFVD